MEQIYKIRQMKSISEDNNDSQKLNSCLMVQQGITSRTNSEEDLQTFKNNKKFSLSSEDFDNQLNSQNRKLIELPCQIQQNPRIKQIPHLPVESSRDNTTNSDKLYYSKSQEGNEQNDEIHSQFKGTEEQFDKNFIENELKEMQEVCLANQRYMEQIDKKYKLKGRRNLTINDKSEISNTNISVIQKNTPDLSFNNCDKLLNFSEIDTATRLQQMIQENIVLQSINDNLQNELINQKNHLFSQGENSTAQREIQIKNNYISELQKKVFEIEKEQIEKQSEGIAQIQCLETKYNHLKLENQKLSSKLQQIQKENEQLQEKQNESTNLQQQLKNLQKEYDNYKQQQKQSNSDRKEYFKIKTEFEEFQQVTQNIINQEQIQYLFSIQREDYQKRISELENELNQSHQIQEELVQTLTEKEELFSSKFRELKQKFQEDLLIQKKKFEQQEEYLKEQTSYLFQSLSQSEAARSHLEQIFNKEIEAARQYSQQQYIVLEQQLKKVYEKQIQEKNHIIFQYQEKLSKYSKPMIEIQENDLNSSVHRSKSLSQQGLLKNYANNIRQGMVPNSKFVNSSFDEEQFGKIKSNNIAYQNSGQKRNTSYSQQKPTKYINLSIEKENNCDQSFKNDLSWKQKSNLYSKQLEQNGILSSQNNLQLITNQYINSNFSSQNKFLNNQLSKPRQEQTNTKNYLNENYRLFNAQDLNKQQLPKHQFIRK